MTLLNQRDKLSILNRLLKRIRHWRFQKSIPMAALMGKANLSSTSQEFQEWHSDVNEGIEIVFGEHSHWLAEFNDIAYSETMANLLGDKKAKEAAFWSGLEQAEALLKSTIEEIRTAPGFHEVATGGTPPKTRTSPTNNERTVAQPELEDFPVLPDNLFSKITHSMMYVIERDDIQTENDLKQLIQQMFEYPDRDFYFFQEKEGARNEIMLAADRLGRILMSETELFYYKHPNFKRDYIKIERTDGNYRWEWERDVVEKGPMFMRTKLKLTERTKIQLETLQRIALEEEFRKRKADENEFDVFLSYGSQDRQLAVQLYEAITAAGGAAFLAEKSLRPGEDFADRIKAALRKSRELWVLVSPNSLGSDWVVSEWGAAWALDKRIVPILYRCAPDSLPDRIRRLHCIDFHRYPELITMTFPTQSERK